MVFWMVLAIILIISFFWALWSLRKEQSKSKEIKNAEEELAREKILFRSE